MRASRPVIGQARLAWRSKDGCEPLRHETKHSKAGIFGWLSSWPPRLSSVPGHAFGITRKPFGRAFEWQLSDTFRTRKLELSSLSSWLSRLSSVCVLKKRQSLFDRSPSSTNSRFGKNLDARVPRRAAHSPHQSLPNAGARGRARERPVAPAEYASNADASRDPFAASHSRLPTLSLPFSPPPSR